MWARNRHDLRTVLTRTVVWSVLVIGSAVMVIPFAWLVSSSLKGSGDIWVFPPKWIPSPIMWRNYVEALTTLPFHIYLKNTSLIVVLSMLGTLFSASLCAYGFSQYRFPGRDLVFMVLLSTMMLPSAILIIPQFVICRYLGWVNTFLPLIVPTFLGGGAFNVFLLRQFFRTLPRELSDAARIDGCSEFQIYLRIILPLAKPALATIAVFTFMFAWNDFMGPLIYINSPAKLTLALGLASFRGLYATQWHLLMAASVVMVAPVIIVFFCAQKYFVQGIVLTGMVG